MTNAKEMSLKELYNFYLSFVETKEGMCISLETARWMINRATQLNVTAIADYGSGFSSLAFRWWALGQSEVKVFSTDHDIFYLNLTKQLCQKIDLGTDGFFLHDSFWAEDIPPLDIQLMDLDGVYRRVSKSEVSRMCRVCKEDGLIIYDDWHMPNIKELATRKLRYRNFVVREIEETLDDFGRFVGEARRF